MAGQRWSESRRDLARGAARRAGLFLLTPALAVLIACTENTGPNRPGSGFGQGISQDATSPAASLVGTWQAVTTVQVPGDLQTSTTTWVFDASGVCRETAVTVSVAEGTTRTTDVTCTWTSTDTAVTVTFSSGGTLIMPFSLVSSDILLLDGFQYQRVA
jgi:hypothetical protein